MREIRFRAWDNVRHEFLSAGQVILAIQSGRNPETIHYLDILQSPNLFKDRFDIQQFTGIKDKNGKEIYSGDILLLHGIPELEGKKVSVTFDMGAFRDTYYGWVLEGKPDNYEVLGNIYENPELLKSRTEPKGE